MNLEWLPDLTAWDPADFGAASGVGTLLVAVAATVIARRQLKQARQLREEEAAPAVIVDVLPDETAGFILDLVIENIGRTAARDVKITFDPPVKSATDMAGYELTDWSPLKDGIKTLVPGRRLTAMFDSSVDRYESDLPRQYEVTVECSDSHGRPQQAVQYTIDLEPLYGALHSQVKGVHHLVKEVEKLRKAVEPIAKKRLTVEVFDGEAELRRRAELRDERWRRHQELVERVKPPVDPQPEGPPFTSADDEPSEPGAPGT